MAESRTRTLTSDDGLSLHVRELGPADAPTVLLVHGYPDSGDVWSRVADLLADRFHVVVPDVRGAGRSEAPRSREGYSLDHLVADIATVIEATSPDAPVHLVGHDWGSIQSWEAVTGGTLDGRIATYTSMSGPSLDHIGQWLRTGDVGDGRSRTRRFLDRAKQAPKSWYVFAFHTPLATVPWRFGLAKRWPMMLERMEGIEPEAGHPAPTLVRDASNGVELYRANIRPRMRSPRERTTEVPVQLIVPQADRFVSPAMADAALPHCASVIRREVPDGHWGLLRRRPEVFAQLLTDFIER